MASGTLAARRLDRARPRASEPVEGRVEQRSLGELLTETRILLPGTQVFLGFLTMLPFTDRFEALPATLRTVYVWTFLANLLALACFVAPAAYHRIARPIRDKIRYKVLATRLLIIGLAPFSVCVVLATYLVTSVVMPRFALVAASGVGTVVVMLWWVMPAMRLHRLEPLRDDPRRRKEGSDGEV
jgi:uncharacterized protein DUF6328